MRTVLLSSLAFVALLLGAGHAHGQDEPMARMVKVGVGDYWEFEISGRDQGTVRNEIKARGTHTTWFGDKVETYRVHATGEVESQQSPAPNLGVTTPSVPVTTTFATNKWVRATDYAVVEIEGNATTQGEEAVYSLESFQPPLVEAVFDFGVGWQWRSEAQWHFERSVDPVPRDTDVFFVAKVQGYETVTVPAGTFQAWRVNLTSYKLSNAYTIQWYSETACDLVKEERYNDADELINRLELVDYRCDGTILPRPVYDPDHVTLLAAGETPPPGWTDDGLGGDNGVARSSDGPGWPAALGALGVSVGAVGAVLWFRRR